MWLTKLHLDRVFSEYFDFPLSSFHQYCILFFIGMLLFIGPTCDARQTSNNALSHTHTATALDTVVHACYCKVKQSHYRTGEAPEGCKRLRLPHFRTIGT